MEPTLSPSAGAGATMIPSMNQNPSVLKTTPQSPLMENPLSIPKAEAQGIEQPQSTIQLQPMDFNPGGDSKFTNMWEQAQQHGMGAEPLLDAVIRQNPNPKVSQFLKVFKDRYVQDHPNETPNQAAQAAMNFMAYKNIYGKDGQPPQETQGLADHLTNDIQDPNSPNYQGRPFDPSHPFAQFSMNTPGGRFLQNPKEGLKSVADTASDYLPAAMGAIGGAAGTVIAAPTVAGIGLGAVAGAGMGTAAGEEGKHAIKRLIGTENSQQEPIGKEVKDVATQGAIGTISEIGGQYLAKAANYVAQGLSGKAGRIINSLIKPVNNEFKYGKNVGQAIVDEGITGGSLEELGQNVGNKVNEIGKQISSTIENASKNNPAQIDVTKIIEDSFAPAIKEANQLPRTGASQLEYLNNLKQDLLDAYGGTHVPLGVFEAKQGIQGMIKFNAADPFNGVKNEALWSTFQGLKNANNQAVDGLSALNERYSNLVGAKASIARRIMNEERRNVVGLIPAIGGVAAGSSEYGKTGDIKKALVAGGLGALGTNMASSTTAKTYEAQIMNSMPSIVQSAIKTLGPAAKTALIKFLGDQMNSSNSPTK